jgi:DNA-binding Lrp family transcriptional regulator
MRPEISDLDQQIIKEMQRDGRISISELAKSVNLSVPATHVHVKKLEKEGYIRRYTAVVDYEKLGYDLKCFLQVTLQWHQTPQLEAVMSATGEMPEVLECYKVTGEFDFLLKVILRNHRELDQFINKIGRIPGVARINTHIVVDEIKSN